MEVSSIDKEFQSCLYCWENGRDFGGGSLLPGVMTVMDNCFAPGVNLRRYLYIMCWVLPKVGCGLEMA